MASAQSDPLAVLQREARPLSGPDDLQSLLDQIASADTVLLGEATHGTTEFYRVRARLTSRLIEERGFDAVAIEADWPDALRASRWAQGSGEDRSPDEALGGFQRFPQWMWRNDEMVAFLQRLRDFNLRRPDGRPPVGLFGLDLYSLRSSMREVLNYLDRVDPAAAYAARRRYSCFDHFGEDPQYYGQAVRFGLAEGCEREVMEQLSAMSAAAHARLLNSEDAVDDEHFYARQNARVVQSAEAYYRTMFDRRVSSWNLRDDHMAGTLAELRSHLSRRLGRTARIVVWAHNSHVGDARHTGMGDEGEINLGQRVREAPGSPQGCFLLGFTTHDGTVTAATDWDGAAERKRVLPSRIGSHERLLHEVGLPAFLLPLRDSPAVQEALAAPRLQRAIGVIYRPDTELMSHYFRARLASQFDAVVHIDRTSALPPLDASALWPQPHEGEAETFPSGL